MERIESYIIDGIDYGSMCIELERKAEFKDNDTWEGYVSSVLKALDEVRAEIVDASKKTSQNLGRGSFQLGFDHPTDVIWTMSIIFVMRTIAMLTSKSLAPARSIENRNAHRQLVERYLNIIRKLSEKKEELDVLFPH